MDLHHYIPDIIQDENTGLLLREILACSPISRKDLSDKTDLAPPTVSRIIGRLLDHDYVREIGYGKSLGGRKPVLLELNTRAATVVGISIEIDHVQGAIIDLAGEIIDSEYHSIVDDQDGRRSQEQVMDSVTRLINSLLKSSSQEKIMGIGVGIHGLVDPYRGISVYPSGFDWINLPLVDILKKQFDYPILMENNAHALALGESWFGAARDIDNFLCLKVDSAIGAGLFTNGRLYRGIHHAAGEIGHTTVDEGGELCRCGSYGCLETKVSLPSILRRTRTLIRQGAKSSLYHRVEGKLDTIDEQALDQAAKEGDRVAGQVLEEAGRFLGISLANIVNILDPGAIIIGGRITELMTHIEESLRETLEIKTLSFPGRDTEIRISALGENGVAVGAGTLFLDSFYSSNRINFSVHDDNTGS